MDYLVIQQTANETVVARFRQQRKTLSFVGATRRPLADGLTLTEQLAERCDLTSEESRSILTLLPSDVFFRELTLPLTDRRKLREILPIELKGETALDADELLFDALPMREGKVLAAWVRTTVVTDGIDQLSAMQLEPEIVTSTLFHWQHLLPADTTPEMITALSDGDSLALFQGIKPLFFRNLPGKDPVASITSTLAALEIGQGIKIDRFYTHGALARIEQDFHTAVEPLPVGDDYAATFGGDNAAAHDLAGAYAVARACVSGDQLNFRSGSLAYTKNRDKLRKKLLLTAILAAVFVLLLFSETGIRYYLVKKDLASLNSSISSIYKELLPNRKKSMDEVGELRSEIKRLGAGNASGNILQILRQLAEAKTDDITGIFETEIDGDQVRLKGDAKSNQAVQNFLTKMAINFSGSEVSEMKSRPDGTVSFTFRGTFKREKK
jgi:general secretion pathway protein L